MELYCSPNLLPRKIFSANWNSSKVSMSIDSGNGIGKVSIFLSKLGDLFSLIFFKKTSLFQAVRAQHEMSTGLRSWVGVFLSKEKFIGTFEIRDSFLNLTTELKTLYL